jgi:hypothetical protein
VSPPDKWELRDCDDQFLTWLYSSACVADSFIRVRDWLKQAWENGPPPTAEPGNARNEWLARVPMTDTVITFLKFEDERALVITDIWSKP